MNDFLSSQAFTNILILAFGTGILSGISRLDEYFTYKHDGLKKVDLLEQKKTEQMDF